MNKVKKQITKRKLRSLSGTTIYERGERYFFSGTISGLRVINNKVISNVAGSGYKAYQVKLWSDKDRLNYDCSCPMGEEGACCKHVIATGLAFLENQDTKLNQDDMPLEDDSALIRKYLKKKKQRETVGNAAGAMRGG